MQTLAYIIYSLCSHPEYIEAIRAEVLEKQNPNADDPFKDMHLLDSFLLEVARLNPPDACKTALFFTDMMLTNHTSNRSTQGVKAGDSP